MGDMREGMTSNNGRKVNGGMVRMETYGAGWTFQDADLAVSLFQDVVDCAHELKLDVVGLVGVVKVGWGFRGHFGGVVFGLRVWVEHGEKS
jgi:hypothetical protein